MLLCCYDAIGGSGGWVGDGSGGWVWVWMACGWGCEGVGLRRGAGRVQGGPGALGRCRKFLGRAAGQEGRVRGWVWKIDLGDEYREG